MIIKLNAGHDRNGNPRRCYVNFGANGEFINAWDEGYYGYAAVPKEMQEEARRAPQIITTPTEYKQWLKLAK